MQSIVAVVNLASYYAVGIPLGLILTNVFNLGVKVLIPSFLFIFTCYLFFFFLRIDNKLSELQGLWSGMLAGIAIQTVILCFIIYKTDWELEVKAN